MRTLYVFWLAAAVLFTASPDGLASPPTREGRGAAIRDFTSPRPFRVGSEDIFPDMRFSFTAAAVEDVSAQSLQLTLPPEIYAVADRDCSIYFDNIVLAKSLDNYRFEVDCPIGRRSKRSWTVRPTGKDVGEHRLTVHVRDAAGNAIARASSRLRVIAANAGAGEKIRLLIIGDSLTHATAYPNEIARLLAAPANPAWQMFGTHKPKSAATGVAHEGYGGWTWQRFVTQYEPHPDGTHRKRSSPFVYLGSDGKPGLDVKRYIREQCGATAPDYVIFMLGINDCFSAPVKQPDARIDAMFQQADVLLKAFRDAAPQAEFGICLTTPPNSRDSAFESNYKGLKWRLTEAN